MHAEDSIMRTTIKDIARECGVSTATVSLALSGRKTKISEKTCKKIREIKDIPVLMLSARGAEYD